MSNQNPTVGLIRLPALAAALSEAGIRVATGDDFRSAAKAVVQAAKAGPVVVLMADAVESGQSPWIEKTLRAATSAIVRVDLDAVVDDPSTASIIAGNTGEVPRVDTPAAVADVLAAVGLPCPPALADATITTQGRITRPTDPVERPTVVAAVPSWPGEDPELESFPTTTDPGWDAQPATSRPPLTASQPAPGAPSRPAPPTVTSSLDDDWAALDSSFPSTPAAPAPPPTGAAYVREEPTPPAAAPATGVGDFPVAATTHGAPVIFVGAGKGGVSKSTTAMTLAQRAARLGHMKVVLIDGNRGQGDTRTFMRLTRASLPTVYDVATGADPSQVIVTPDRLAANRQGDLDRLEFAMVMAPPNGLADPTLVTSDVYLRVLEHARSVADLVVVDTQIQESADTSGLFDDVWIPALSTHAWYLGISDLSTPGVDNLMKVLRHFTTLGVPNGRMAVMLNRVSRGLSFDENRTRQAFSRYGRWLGVVHNDDTINALTNNGELPWDHEEFSFVLDQLLFQVTEDPVFTRSRTGQPERVAHDKSEGGGLLGFFRRKGS